MKIIYDPYVDALSITFRTGKVKETLEIAPEIILDVDAKSRPLYLEILGAKEKLGKANTEEVMMKNLVFSKNLPRRPVRRKFTEGGNHILASSTEL